MESAAPAPLVSVCVITYNHARYVRQAIESVLAQKVSFGLEILIGEDASNDGTRESVLEYQEKHPGLIRVLLHRREDVIRVNGNPTGRWNYFDTLAHTRGKYVAFVEGDDYWTDPLKLQKQVDLLEARPDLAVCGHWAVNVDEHGALTPEQAFTGTHCPREFSIADALGSTPVHPNTWMFRRFDLRMHPAYPLLLKLPAADDPLMMVLLGLGNGHCLPEYMSAYRLHAAGTWSSKSSLRKDFEVLQFRITTVSLLPRRLRPRAIWEVSFAIILYCLNLLLTCTGLRRGSVREVIRLVRIQTVLSAPQLAGWFGAAVALFPVHLAAFLARRATKLLA